MSEACSHIGGLNDFGNPEAALERRDVLRVLLAGRDDLDVVVGGVDFSEAVAHLDISNVQY